MNAALILQLAQQLLALGVQLHNERRDATADEVQRVRASLDQDFQAASANLDTAVDDRRTRDAAESSSAQP